MYKSGLGQQKSLNQLVIGSSPIGVTRFQSLKESLPQVAPKMQPVLIPEIWTLVTISEAAALYHYAPNTIRYHLNRGNLQFRQTGKVYLITLQSLIALWGLPKLGDT